jgi:sensor histidine kinase YesM
MRAPSATTIDEPARRPITLLAGAILTGVLLGVLFATAIHFLMNESEGGRFTRTALQQSLFFGLWGAIVVPLWFGTARLDRVHSASLRTLLIVVVGIGVWIVHASALYVLSGIYSDTRPSFARLPIAVLRMVYIETIVYGAVVAGLMAARARMRARAHERRAAMLALQLSRARLETLQSRLQPHFLFNALHTVSMLARAGDTERIVDVTARLGGVLRVMLDDDDEAETTLRDELELVDRYLAIELIRFGDRLDVVVETDPGALDGLVPRFILQPLVENAMRHGIAPRTERGCIRIRTRRVDETLVVSVTDDGPGAEPTAPHESNGRPGLGLRITRERLTGMYGNAASLDVATTSRGTVAEVTVPWHTTPVELNGMRDV